MQTLFNREHNRIAQQLAAVNPTWTDDTLYNEARRINIAQIQHIVYNEFVPTATGNMKIKPLVGPNYFSGYDSSVNPAISNEFATAAFRMGHSLVRQILSRADTNIAKYENKSYAFEKVVFQSELAYE